MALTREQKETRVKETAETLSSAVSVVFVTYDALQLADMNALRDQLFEAGVSMRVIPKRLAKIALENAELNFDPTAQEGQLALVWGDDVVSPAKVLAGFAKDHEQLQLVGGVMDPSSAKASEGKVELTAEQVVQLSTMPSKEELLAKLVGTLAGPISGFQSVLSGVPRNAVYVLSAIKDQKE